jgi:hypothetical protein
MQRFSVDATTSTADVASESFQTIATPVCGFIQRSVALVDVPRLDAAREIFMNTAPACDEGENYGYNNERRA